MSDDDWTLSFQGQGLLKMSARQLVVARRPLSSTVWSCGDGLFGGVGQGHADQVDVPVAVASLTGSTRGVSAAAGWACSLASSAMRFLASSESIL